MWTHLLFIAAFLLQNIFAENNFSGVWIQHGNALKMNRSVTTFLKGTDYGVRWKDVEVANGKWDWTSFDKDINELVEAGYYLEMQLQVGPDSPQWIYNHDVGVPKVLLPKNETIHGWTDYPYYLSPKYQYLFLRAIDTFANHLENFSTKIKSKIVAAQAEYGSTGDDTPWHGEPIDSKYHISDKEWDNFTQSLVPIICKSYTSRGFHVLWNWNYDKLINSTKICPKSFIKAGMVSHSFQVNFEADNYLLKGSICHSQNMHCRGESWPFCQAGFYKEAPLWNTYWHLLWQLTFGVDMPGLSQINLENPMYAPYYEQFNTYASSVRPPAEEWPGAILALRDGLDSNDTHRFPEDVYGKAEKKNKDRLIAIAKAFEKNGAQEGDPSAATGCAMASRSPKKMNDVGWRIWTGNYGNGRMTQIDPSNTSVGWWRVGPKDQPYGRFARGFSHKKGMDSMYFSLDRKLWGGLPFRSSDKHLLEIRIVFFDEGNGKWELWFDSQSNPKKVALQVTKKNTNRWKEVTANVTDARFDGRCGRKGADIALVSSDTEDDIFHLVEIIDRSKR